jgi:hypothetical protein
LKIGQRRKRNEVDIDDFDVLKRDEEILFRNNEEKKEMKKTT